MVIKMKYEIILEIYDTKEDELFEKTVLSDTYPDAEWIKQKTTPRFKIEGIEIKRVIS
jgi:hypothetical protein